MKIINRYWGYVLLVALFYFWTHDTVGPGALLALSGVDLLYFVFRAPAVCGAVNRNQVDLCRNNAYGFLMGCKLNSHKWQKFAFFSKSSTWGHAAASFWGHWKNIASCVGVFGTLVSALVAIITLLTRK
jgi:hypothetical protein